MSGAAEAKAHSIHFESLPKPEALGSVPDVLDASGAGGGEVDLEGGNDFARQAAAG